MLRFLSKKRGRHGQKLLNHVKSGTTRSYSTNKHTIQCKVILLDGTDLSVDLSVRRPPINHPFFSVLSSYDESFALCMHRSVQSIWYHTHRGVFVRNIGIMSRYSSMTVTEMGDALVTIVVTFLLLTFVNKLM